MSYQYPPSLEPHLQPQPQANNNETIMIGGVVLVILIVIFLVIYNNFIDVPSTSSSSFLFNNLKTTPSSDYANCKGDWGTCSSPCGDGTQKYKIITPKKGEGKNCTEDEGASRICKIKDCPVDCIGEWGSCSATCGEGTKKYIVTTPKKGDGKICSHGHGATQTCTVGDYILNCEKNHSNFKNFYETNGGYEIYKLEADGSFPAGSESSGTITPIKSKLADNNQCELEYLAQGITRKRIFTLERNDANCTWNVIAMNQSQ
jgi:hypothetical protein